MTCATLRTNYDVTVDNVYNVCIDFRDTWGHAARAAVRHRNPAMDGHEVNVLGKQKCVSLRLCVCACLRVL